MTVRKEKNGTWTAIVYIEGKQVWRRGHRTKKAAQKTELELRAGLDGPALSLKFDELAELFLAHQKQTCRPSTVKTNESRYAVHVKPYLGSKYIDNISVGDIQKIVHTLVSSQNGYSATYINLITGTIRKIFNYGIDMGYVDKNPAKKIKKLKEKKKDMKYISIDEAKLLFDTANNDFLYRCFLELLLFSGIRVGEARALWWEQVDFDKNTITINAHVVDKGGVRRDPGRKNHKNYTIFMTQRVRTLLLQIYDMEKKKDGFTEHRYVFGFYEPWSYNMIRTRFDKLLKKCGLRDDLTLHSLRHGFASLLANNGATIQELAAALGDTLEVTLGTYSHMYDNVHQKICDRMDDVVAGLNLDDVC